MLQCLSKEKLLQTWLSILMATRCSTGAESPYCSHHSPARTSSKFRIQEANFSDSRACCFEIKIIIITIVIDLSKYTHPTTQHLDFYKVTELSGPTPQEVKCWTQIWPKRRKNANCSIVSLFQLIDNQRKLKAEVVRMRM